ncbi:MAG: winged helix DNA-binding domain-containing protein [Coriobacteriia bacterium]|nr:winged helix DNA-binding domain-containing protein [Coriobacteriia bacterium]
MCSTTNSAVSALVSAGVLPADPLPWIMGSGEPIATWLVLTEVLGRDAGDPSVVAARLQVVGDPAVRTLIAELPAWGSSGSVSDHHNPLFAPNRLGLLADLGVRAGDDDSLDALLDAMLSSRDRHGRFVIPESLAARPKPERGAVTCDSNAILDVALRLGRSNDARVTAALKRLAGDSSESPQGRGWRCLPEKRPLIDFTVRRTDACPQVTLEAARALAHVPADQRPAWASDAARTLLAFWRLRAEERPYDFGHGYQFKTVKWPSFWYDALAVLDVVSRFPEVWDGGADDDADAIATAQIAAALVSHNVGADGRVSPVRTHCGFGRFSFGRRGEPSPYATARVLAVLARLAPLAGRIAAVDVAALPSSRPLGARPDEAARSTACPVPRTRSYDPARVLPRVLTRQHLNTPWEPASIESLAGDIVGFTAADPATPYLSLAARLPNFEPAALDRALDERGSLVRIRCMRGVLYAVRRDLVPIVHAASTRQVTRFARDFVKSRGIVSSDYERIAAQVLDATAEKPLTTAELRERLRPNVDLAAVVTLMCAEASLARCAPRDGRFGRVQTFAPFAQVFPDIALGRISEDDARAELLRAYVRGFGPVSARDAAWWTGMDLKRVRRAFNALEDELTEITLRGHEGTWLMHVADAEELERASLTDGSAVALLPTLDPLILSYTDRSRFLDDAARPYVFDAARHVTSVVLVNGRIAGIWDVLTCSEPEVLVHLFAEASVDTRDRVASEAAHLGSMRCGRTVRTRFVDSMVPLSERPIGAYTHPLR